jgi:hypothetical protein
MNKNVTLSETTLSILALDTMMLGDITLSAANKPTVLGVVLQNVVMLSVVAPAKAALTPLPLLQFFSEKLCR